MRAGSSQALGVVLAVTGVLVISPDGLLLRLLSTDIWTILFWRGVLPALTIAMILTVQYRAATVAQFRAVGMSGLVVIVLFATSNILFVAAILLTTVANVFVITSAQPLFAAIFGRIFLGEPVRARTWIATGAVLVGVAVIFSGSIEADGLAGDLCAFAGAMIMAGHHVVVRRARAVSMVPAVALGCLVTAVIVAPFAAPFSLSSEDMAIFLVLGLIVLPVPFFFTTLAPRYIPAHEVALIVLLEAVIGPVLVWWVIDEVPAPETFVGGALILGTLALYFTLVLRDGGRAARSAVS